MHQQNVLPIIEPSEDRFAGLKPGDLREDEARSLVSLALAVLEARHRPGQSLRSPDESQAYLRLLLGERKAEVFCCLFLDLCAALRNVELGHQGRFLTRIRRRQLHISLVTVGASS